MNNTRVKIDFFGIGAQRAGTSWLYYCLNKLPDFALPPIKELHYFDRAEEYPSPSVLHKTTLKSRILNFKWLINALSVIYNNKNDVKKLAWFYKWFFSNFDDNWYLSLFENTQKLKGEICPSYSFLQKRDIRRMYSISPNAKIILIIRNPVDRAWSQFRFSTRNQEVLDINYLKMTKILEFMNSRHQELRSNYVKTLENYISIFPKNQILVCFYDAIVEQPEKILCEIVDFIGGDKSSVLNYCNPYSKLNQSKKIEMPYEVRMFLKKKYYPQIKKLASDYSGYPLRWFSNLYGNNARVLVKDNPYASTLPK